MDGPMAAEFFERFNALVYPLARNTQPLLQLHTVLTKTPCLPRLKLYVSAPSRTSPSRRRDILCNFAFLHETKLIWIKHAANCELKSGFPPLYFYR